MHLTTLPRPFIVAVATDRSVESTLATIRQAANQGAHAIELNLPAISDATDHELKQMLGESPIPVYTSCRRAPFMGVYGFRDGEVPVWADEERMERQLAALHFGSRAIDMEMDTFDPHPAPPIGSAEASPFASEPGEPAELTDDPVAIACQREIINEAHTAGAEVILSCHTARPQSVEQLLAIGKRAVERGGDLLKIVTPCRNAADLLALLQATVEMKQCLRIPFILVGGGQAGLISRSIGVNFGSSWIIAQVERTPDGFPDQPLVREVVEMSRLLPWRVEKLPCPARERGWG
jgi:3-dehydroquinate dehydratase